MAGALFSAAAGFLARRAGVERERERERCVSEADASSYGTPRAHNDPPHICPVWTHAKTTPLHAVRPLSPYSPAALASIHIGTDPNQKPIPCPQPGSTTRQTINTIA